MNLKRHVWLPPDGDPRLVRFQQQAASAMGWVDGVPWPAHLELTVPLPRPQGAVETREWAFLDDGPVLEAADSMGPIGFFRLGLPPIPQDTAAQRALLPPAPRWRWERGVLATLELGWPLGGRSFTVWSWSSRRGWKADRPTP